MDFFDNINIDALQPLQDISPDGWFDDIRQSYGESLSDEMTIKEKPHFELLLPQIKDEAMQRQLKKKLNRLA